MSIQAIRGALQAHLIEACGWADRTSYEGVGFAGPQPGTLTPYQLVAVLFAEPNSYGLGPGALERGIFQVTLCWPVSVVREQGLGAINARVEEIRAAFPKNARIGGAVKVARKPEVTRLGIDGDRDLTVIRIRFIER